MYYPEKMIVHHAKLGEQYTHIPKGLWLAIIRMNLDDQKPNEFNDVAVLMDHDRYVMDTTCTSVPGLPALKGGFKKYNKHGAAIVCANVWMYDTFEFGYHRGKMRALREILPLWTTRDGDMNNIAEEYGKKRLGMPYTNFHASTYKYLDTLIRKWIGAWSYGCIVCNNRFEYDKIIDLCEYAGPISMIILPEFPV